MNGPKILRWAIALQLIGLGLESISIFNLTPVTFIVFIVLGSPLILTGVALYIFYILRELVTKGAL